VADEHRELWQHSEDGRVCWLVPQWPAPDLVCALVTSRQGGVSVGPYCGLNLGTHVDDDPAHVSANRELLAKQLPPDLRLGWMNQVHGTRVIDAAGIVDDIPEADAAWVSAPGAAALVFFADQQGSVAAVAHAGWRGLLDGILENTVASLPVKPGKLLAWLGPAIAACHFEVGDEVRESFLARAESATQRSEIAGSFTRSPQQADKWMMDIYQVARIRLGAVGVKAVHGGDLCTVCDDAHFFSYRRDGVTGRMASVIYIKQSAT
jgi:polyphenol oxidase